LVRYEKFLAVEADSTHLPLPTVLLMRKTTHLPVELHATTQEEGHQKYIS
jgi:hypothetical protein